MAKILEFIATLACGIFTGAAIYINLVEHPARMKCGTQIAVTEWRPSYKRAAVMQASLAFFGSLAAVVACGMGSSYWWLVGGLVFFSVIPFTLIVIMPVNKRLLDTELDVGSDLAADLLRRWNRLHVVRSILALAAFVIFLCL